MKDMRFLVCIVCCAIITSAWGITLDVETELELSFVSDYVWRGRLVNSEPCFQPMLSVGANNLSFSAWGTWDLTDVANSSSHSRADLAIEYSVSRGANVMAVGLTSYIYHDSSGSSIEDTFDVYLRYVAEVLLLPSLEIRYDFSAYDGWYGTASIAHSFRMLEYSQDSVGLDLDIKLSMGACDQNYASGYYAVSEDTMDGLPEFKPDKPALADFIASIWLPIWFSENVSLTPMVRFIAVMDSDIRNAWSKRDMETEHWLYGVSLDVSF